MQGVGHLSSPGPVDDCSELNQVKLSHWHSGGDANLISQKLDLLESAVSVRMNSWHVWYTMCEQEDYCLPPPRGGR